jgi:hypothetical protein
VSWPEWARSSTAAIASHSAGANGSAEWDLEVAGSASATTSALWWWRPSASPRGSHLPGVPQYPASIVHQGRGPTWCRCMVESSGIQIPATPWSFLRGHCWGPSASEGPQKHDLTMFSKWNMWTGIFGIGLLIYKSMIKTKLEWDGRRLWRRIRWSRSYAQKSFGMTAGKGNRPKHEKPN